MSGEWQGRRNWWNFREDKKIAVGTFDSYERISTLILSMVVKMVVV